MKVWQWVSHLLPSRRGPPPLEAVEAREVAERLSAQADRLNEHLQKYNRARDPFAALMADLYNRDQMSRVYRGPSS